jgi:FAD/FMN-containing dehydrogenase
MVEESSPATPRDGSRRPSGWHRVRRRLGRALRLAGRVLLVILAFGALVSLVSLWRTPAVSIASRGDAGVRVDEVTRLYPVTVARVVRPRNTGEVAAAVRGSSGPVSIGGGRFSMGGQTAAPGALQLDMRQCRGVVAFDPGRRTITVRAGTRWREVQEAVDPAGLAVKIMQTYDTFTVGGSLSVNCHGRYVGQGPLVRSVRSLRLVLADGSVVDASPTQNPELFYGAIGGYGAIGVIAEATLDLAENSRVRREDESMPIARYARWFRERVRDDPAAVFHNGDIYPPAYDTVHAVSYRRTTELLTIDARLQPADQTSWQHRAGYTFITGWPGGRWVRRHVLDPLLFRGNPVTWRNYEASYDVSELEPASRQRHTYVLQEYFVPVERFDAFAREMRRILRRHDVNAVNVSIRHALRDPGTLLAWAPEEVFAFVLYYRQDTDPESRREVGRWTRGLIDAVLRHGGRHYLPYQPLATRAQFRRAYPGSARLFALDHRVDPGNRFTNVLWDLYQPAADGTVPEVTAEHLPSAIPAEVRIALDTIPGYARAESAAYSTHPEWDLVYGSEAYARWLADGRRPSGFPYVGSVGTFWRSYVGTWRAARARYSFGLGSHVMLGVIGISTAVEYGLKGLYENTVGRLFELAAPAGGTAEDRYAARVAADYAALITTRGWYEFPFGHALGELWTEVPWGGPGKLRKWERRFALSAEYGVKAVYAALIGLGTGAAYSPDKDLRYLVAVGWPPRSGSAAALRPVARLDRGYTLLSVRRYAPFRDALLALAERADEVRLAELSGSELVTLTGTAPAGWRSPARSTPVVAYATPADRSRVRVLLAVSARDLLDVLRELRREASLPSPSGGFVVDHVYDY